MAFRDLLWSPQIDPADKAPASSDGAETARALGLTTGQADKQTAFSFSLQPGVMFSCMHEMLARQGLFAADAGRRRRINCPNIQKAMLQRVSPFLSLSCTWNLTEPMFHHTAALRLSPDF